MVGPLLRSLASYVPGADSIRLRDLASYVGTRLDRRPHESDFVALRDAFGMRDPVVLDVGANRGQSIRSIRSVVGQCSITAVEPNPRLASYLVRRFPQVVVRNLALGTHAGELELFIPRYGTLRYDTRASSDELAAGQAFGVEEFWRFRRERCAVERVVVPMVTIDMLNIEPDLIKVDTEGMEGAVVAGGISTITKSRPVLMVEGSGAEAADTLRHLGYATFHWDDDARALRDGPGVLNSFVVAP